MTMNLPFAIVTGGEARYHNVTVKRSGRFVLAVSDSRSNNRCVKASKTEICFIDGFNYEAVGRFHKSASPGRGLLVRLYVAAFERPFDISFCLKKWYNLDQS